MKLYINLNNTFIVLFLMINIFFKYFSSNNHSYMYMSSIYTNTPPYLLIYTTPYTSEHHTLVSHHTCIYTYTLHIIHQNTLPRNHQYPINPCIHVYSVCSVNVYIYSVNVWSVNVYIYTAPTTPEHSTSKSSIPY